MTASAVRIIDF
jgi:predicted RNase H-like HicB family nuclease